MQSEVDIGFWEYIYLVGTYLVVIACLFAAGKIWYVHGWRRGLGEVLTLVGFAVAYWLLESHAQIAAPFYVYPDRFPDMIPFFDWSQFGIGASLVADMHVCNRTGAGISATVPLLEMSMTYLFFWTARLLLTPYGFTPNVQNLAIAPLMVGLMALVLDGFLDPVISTSFTCVPTTLNHPGMGYWHWFAGSDLANFWYGIPLFNYAAWYAAPVFLVTVVVLIRWLIELILYLRGILFGPAYAAPSFLTGLFQTIIALAAFVVHVTALGAEPPIEQIAAISAAILVSLAVIVANASSYDRTNSFRWEFVAPQIFIFAMPLLMLVFSGKFVLLEEWDLLLLSLLCVAAGFFFALSPYSGTWLIPSSGPMRPPRPNRPAAGGASGGAGGGVTNTGGGP